MYDDVFFGRGGRMKSRVLIVDDSMMSRRIIRGILEAAGHLVTEAVDGAAGIERYSLEKPDLVVLDLVMSGIPGLDVLQSLREIDGQAKVLIVTSDTQTATRKMAERAGSCGFLVKPVTRDGLTDLVNSILNEPRQ